MKTNRAKWGITSDKDTKCDCGVVQETNNLLVCPNCCSTCFLDDLWADNQKAVGTSYLDTKK